jgi:hypothetical protein
MNEALEKYDTYTEVASIHAYVYSGFDGGEEAFFVRGADCRGWGTWRRAWEELETDGQLLYDQIVRKNEQKAFDLGGYSPYRQMLSDQIHGKKQFVGSSVVCLSFCETPFDIVPTKNLGEQYWF